MPDFTTANMILRSFRMTAQITTLPGFPAAFKRLANSCNAGFVRMAAIAGIYNAFLILELPILEIFERARTDDPDS